MKFHSNFCAILLRTTLIMGTTILQYQIDKEITNACLPRNHKVLFMNSGFSFVKHVHKHLCGDSLIQIYISQLNRLRLLIKVLVSAKHVTQNIHFQILKYSDLWTVAITCEQLVIWRLQRKCWFRQRTEGEARWR